MTADMYCTEEAETKYKYKHGVSMLMQIVFERLEEISFKSMENRAVQ